MPPFQLYCWASLVLIVLTPSLALSLSPLSFFVFLSLGFLASRFCWLPFPRLSRWAPPGWSSGCHRTENSKCSTENTRVCWEKGKIPCHRTLFKLGHGLILSACSPLPFVIQVALFHYLANPSSPSASHHCSFMFSLRTIHLTSALTQETRRFWVVVLVLFSLSRVLMKSSTSSLSRTHLLQLCDAKSPFRVRSCVSSLSPSSSSSFLLVIIVISISVWSTFPSHLRDASLSLFVLPLFMFCLLVSLLLSDMTTGWPKRIKSLIHYSLILRGLTRIKRIYSPQFQG